ncbi:hypothetical protein ACLIIZ_19305 [Azonexus caeni]|jgi:hypothetical protein|uniref:hypothetical protein n=1 Tax=Azonexus caeni TaxID=266126 RepID=UPI003A882AA5
MKLRHWLLIVAGIPGGLFVPLSYGLFAGLALLLGYVACHPPRWAGLQRAFAYLFGGLCTGAGLQVLAGYGVRGHLLSMIIAPVVLWLATAVIFSLLRDRYSLTSAPGCGAVTQPANSGSGYGGHRITWQFHDNSNAWWDEPSHGDLVFSNRCAFQNVGPSVKIADDGRYAVMSLSSRNGGTLLVDFERHLAYALSASDLPWEIDAINDGRIHSTVSSLSGTEPVSLDIDHLIAEQPAIPLVEDDGWWLLDDAQREPLPRHDAVSVGSSGGRHTLIFVPDRRPLRDNPFLRFDPPSYALLVDSYLLDIETRHTSACWIDSAEHEGRFLVIGERLFDLMPDGVFAPAAARELPLTSADEFPHASLGEMRAGGPGMLLAEVALLQRSVAHDRAESCQESSTYPWDEEEVDYRDADGQPQRRMRTRIERHALYRIDLAACFKGGEQRLATVIELKNRAHPDYRAELFPLPGYGPATPYAPYRCATSCGVDPGPVLGEFIWSHCGRYLALVIAEPPPAVPGTIRIVDFATATWRDLPGHYPLPGFLWFTADELDFTFLRGICETRYEGPGNFTERCLLVDDPALTETPHDLLFAGIAARRQALAAACRDAGGHASVLRIVRHGMLFAPDFARPVEQGSEENA